MEIMHFNTQAERIRYLKGGFEEIVPQEVAKEPEAEEKPKKAKKGKKKDDTVQTE